MFAQTADGRKVQRGRLSPVAKTPVDAGVPVCVATLPGKDGRSGPERGADGLDETCYVSDQPMGADGYWQIEYPVPRKGRVMVHTGTRDGKGFLANGRVEVSVNGKIWTRAGTFSAKDGTYAFRQATPFRFLRVIPAERLPKALIVRQVEVSE